jgi:ATP-binding cassette, subfamily B, multidrug efflux pump
MAKKENKKKGRVVDVKILKRIFAYARPYKNIVSFAICTTLLLSVLSPLRPYLIQYTFDNFILKSNTPMLFNMLLVLIALLLLEAIIQFADTFLTNMLGQNIIKDLRLELFKHVSFLRLKYYDNTPIGTLVTRTVSDIEVIADIFSEGLIVIMGDILKLLVILVVMLAINYKLALISLASVPLLLLATYLFKNSVAASFQEVRTQVANLNAFVQEHLTGISIVQIFNRERTELNKFKNINSKHRDANIKAIMAYSIFFPVVEILSSVSLALIVWWAGRGVLQNQTSIGELVAFIMYTNMIFRPIRQLADRFNTLQMGMVSSDRVFKVLDTKETTLNTGTKQASNIKGEIKINKLWFAYNHEDWVLKNINLKVNAGEMIALVGATGSGKTSIINLINRFYEFNRGQILLDGVPIEEYELSSLRKNIGVVLQDVFLFADSLKNNITLQNKTITDEQIITAAKLVGAHDFIMALPHNYNYNAMERGAMLSVGQRQLISFLRAYLYNPSILVLDEATSSIDTETEQLIQKATDVLTKNRTSIVIAHRLATIQKADRIIVLDKGEIVESGNHQQLLALNGHYKKLYELQFKEEANKKELID